MMCIYRNNTITSSQVCFIFLILFSSRYDNAEKKNNF
jgi:hypothetical protein